MDARRYIEKVKLKEISPLKTVKSILKETRALKSNNYFTTLSEELAIQQAETIEEKPEGKLAGLPITIKDCILVQNIESRAGSEILRGYKPPFQSTVVQKLINEGAIIIGKTSQDEFGFGSFSTNTKIIPKNPHDLTRSCGGSSGGAAGFTSATKNPHIAISESTGGSIANPASFCGVSGLTPTYGLVSRYGLIDYANSLDKIGTMGKTTQDAFLALKTIAGYDEKDSTSLVNEMLPEKEVKKIAVIKESLEVSPKIKDIVLSKLDNYDIISLPTIKKYSIPAYYLIAMSEASTNLAKYSGIRYGQELPLEQEYNEYFSNVRSKYFSKETKRRIILGTFARMSGFRDAFYLNAMKVRTLIINEYKKAFKKYDLLVSPTMPIIAPKFSEIEKLTPLENYQIDSLTTGPNLAGLPHLSINAGKLEKMPVGIQFIANHLEENKLETIGTKLENDN